MRISPRLATTSKGFTLLEVLIAVLIFSLGLLGMAGLMVVSVKANNTAYLRTQATFLAQTMVDRMRANVIGVWQANYDGNYPGAGANSGCSVAMDGSYTACTPTALAARDQFIFSAQLTAGLPNPTANIACVKRADTPVTAASYPLNPPYDGVCTLRMTWNESTQSQPETFSWVFQP